MQNNSWARLLAYLTGLERHHASESGETTFVYCFDANSILERKNPSTLLDAFLQAFPKASPAKVRLTFKITYPNRKIPEVDYLVVTAGSWDILAEVVVTDDAHLLQLVNRQIRTIPGVTKTESHLYLKLVKQTYNWGAR